ncbi:MAG: response regulator [Alphaproteobacteria bacterium]|nr:response regulator [Alphaproteobacteria bacterium]
MLAGETRLLKEVLMLGTVLIADDNTMVRDSLSYVLRERGYAVLEAEDGEKALDIIAQSDVNLAVIDIMMPSVGGLELRQVLTEHDSTLPIILVTGQPEIVGGLVEDDPDFLSGRMSLLQKPIHPVTLLDEVEKRIDVDRN